MTEALNRVDFVALYAEHLAPRVAAQDATASWVHRDPYFLSYVQDVAYMDHCFARLRKIYSEADARREAVIAWLG